MNEPREKFLGISDAINSSSPYIVSRELNFHRVFCIAGGVGEARVGTRWRKIRAASEYPLENARFLFLTNAIKCRMPLGEFCITAKSIVATHETSDNVSIRQGLSIPRSTM